MTANKIFGYARVSSKDQNEQRQIDSLLPLLDSERDLFIDKASGKDFERPQYQALKSMLRSGATVIFHSLDRLGRNYEQIKNEWQWFADNGIGVKVLDMPTLDTTNQDSNADLINKLIADITLTVLSFDADKERQSIKERQAQGIASAKAKGKKFGRPTVKPDNFDAVYADWKAGKIKAVEAQKLLGMAPSTFYKRAKEMESVEA